MPKRKRTGAVDLFTLRCEQCNRYMVMTESGFWSCPRGHGKLKQDTWNDRHAADLTMFDAKPMPNDWVGCRHCDGLVSRANAELGGELCDDCSSRLERGYFLTFPEIPRCFACRAPIEADAEPDYCAECIAKGEHERP